MVELKTQLTAEDISRAAASPIFGGQPRQGLDTGGSTIFTQSSSIPDNKTEFFRYESGGNFSLVLTGPNGGDLSGDLDLQVFNFAGGEVKRSAQSGNSIEYVTLEQLDGGIYFIAITNQAGRAVAAVADISNNGTSDLIAPERTLDFRTGRAPIEKSDGVSDQDTADFYALAIQDRTDLQIVLDEPSLGLRQDDEFSSPDTTARIIWDKNKDGFVQTSEVTNLDSPNSNNSVVSEVVRNGRKRTFSVKNLDPRERYFIEIASQGSAVFYTLKTSLVRPSQPTRNNDLGALFFEGNPIGGPNDSVSEASAIVVNADLSSLSSNTNPNLSVLSNLDLSSMTVSSLAPLENVALSEIVVPASTGNSVSWKDLN